MTVTLTEVAPSTTWWLVTTSPSEVSTMPVPAAFAPEDFIVDTIRTSPVSCFADALSVEPEDGPPDPPWPGSDPKGSWPWPKGFWPPNGLLGAWLPPLPPPVDQRQPGLFGIGSAPGLPLLVLCCLVSPDAVLTCPPGSPCPPTYPTPTPTAPATTAVAATVASVRRERCGCRGGPCAGG